VPDLSVAGQPTEDRVLNETPQLRPVLSLGDDLDPSQYLRTLSLGGALAPKLSTCTLSARLRSRSLVDDIA
jgi:hypothetical protein